MDELTKRVLGMFSVLEKDHLDLHELFEAGGNDPEQRIRVFDAVERLVKEGILVERDNDFYCLSAQGKSLARENDKQPSPNTGAGNCGQCR